VNKNNKIDQHEFVGVVQSRSFYGSGETGKKNLSEPLDGLKNWFFRSIDKAERIWEIIKEDM